MAFDVVVVGHVAIDINVLPWGVIENALGGAPTYAGLAFAALRRSVGVVSKVGADFPEKFPPIYSKLGLDTEGILVAGEYTTTFENTYDEAGNRRQVCKHVAPKLSPDDIPDAYSDAASFYISPIANEVTPEVLKAVKRKSNLVMLDPQGILREINKDGRVEVKLRDLSDFLKHVDVVKIGKEEARVLKGDVEAALRSIRAAGPKIAILTKGGEPSVVLSDEGLVKVNPLKVDVKDMTGAGDVFGAAFLTKYMATRDILESTKFAVAAAGLKIRYKGPTGFPSEAEILEAMKKL
ncbi:MAG: PfkB family carbohydrate kinase [Candidatus Hodarchaeaceae archaeon]|nr:PfkB family carbohydrate kinase [Candidatus Hodarchaeaceae archaeon]